MKLVYMIDVKQKNQIIYVINSCHKSLLNGRMPMQAQVNKLQLYPKVKEIEQLCPIETMPIM